MIQNIENKSEIKIDADANITEQETKLDDNESVDYDSDEERLALYRSVKKELDKDENSRNDKESGFQFPKNIGFGINFSTPNILESNQDNISDYDSDEERLQRYRSVRKELEENEKNNDAYVISEFELPLPSCEKFKSDIIDDTVKDGIEIIDTRVSHNILEINKSLCNSTNINTNDQDKDFDNQTKKNLIDKSEDQTKSSSLSPAAVLDYQRRSSYDSDEERLENFRKVKALYDADTEKNNFDEKSNIIVERNNKGTNEFSTGDHEISNDIDDSNVKPLEITEEQVYSSDNTEGRVSFDWDLPGQVTSKETLEDRLNLFSGGQCLSFQAEVAAQAVAISKKHLVISNEVSFGGTGEGSDTMFSSEDSDQE